MAKTKRPRYSPAIRDKVVKLARSGTSLTELSKQFGMSTLSIRNWLNAGSGVSAKVPARRGRKPAAAATPDLAHLELENQILRKMVKELMQRA